MCVKGLDGSNHSVRMEIARLLGFVLAKTQLDPLGAGAGGNVNQTIGSSTAGGVSPSESFLILNILSMFYYLV